MTLVTGIVYKVRPDHDYHPNRVGRFQFFAGPDGDVIVMSDHTDDHILFAVGKHDLTDYNPAVDDFVVQVENHYKGK